MRKYLFSKNHISHTQLENTYWKFIISPTKSPLHFKRFKVNAVEDFSKTKHLPAQVIEFSRTFGSELKNNNLLLIYLP